MSKRQGSTSSPPSSSSGTTTTMSSASSPPSKRRLVLEPLQLGPVANLEELEVKTLHLQNQKLSLRLQQRVAIEEDLRMRIDAMEKRQMADDAVINVINRYWNQLNEDIRILLQRFDTETGDESEKQNESSSTTSFLTQLSSWHRAELDDNLASRVQVSQAAVAKIIQAFDHLNQRNERLASLISKNEETKNQDDTEENKKKDENESEKKKEEQAEKDGGSNTKNDGAEKGAGKGAGSEMSHNQLDLELRELVNNLQNENSKVHGLNTSLHEKAHFLSLKHAELLERLAAEETKNEELKNKLDDSDYELNKTRMRNSKIEAMLIETQQKLKLYTVDSAHQSTTTSTTTVTSATGTGSGSRPVQMMQLNSSERRTVEQLTHELEEQRELANNRLTELQNMNESYKQALQEVEKLKMELSTLPEHIVIETTEHKCLQSQFSVLFNEAMQLKTQLDDSRNQYQVTRNAHLRQIEHMEAEELLAQKKLRTEVIQHEDMLSQVRKEYEMLRIEFEQNMAANEQTGPINKEMRNLITSLQSHNIQLKGEVARHKRKGKELQSENVKLRQDLNEAKTAELRAHQHLKRSQEQLHQIMEHRQPGGQRKGSEESGEEEGEQKGLIVHPIKSESDIKLEISGDEKSSDDGKGKDTLDEEKKLKLELSVQPSEVKMELKTEHPAPISSESQTELKSTQGSHQFRTPPRHGSGSSSSSGSASGLKELRDKLEDALRTRTKEQETNKELKSQLKKCQVEIKEMKLLLDMFKTCTKEQRDKAQIMLAEKKARLEIDDLRQQLKRINNENSVKNKEEASKKANKNAGGNNSEEDSSSSGSNRKIRQLEEQVLQLQKQVANHKQEEEALLSEMEVTGQAFEDMQEQNSRLIEQLREKDEANLKLMSERIKSNQIQLLAREEKDMLAQQVNTLSTQVDAQNQVVRKLEEKERLMHASLQSIEKELSLRQQGMEMHKRKAIESAQSAADLKLHLEKYHSQIKEVQQLLADKTAVLEAEAFKSKRYYEELVIAKKKVERLKKIEMASDMDEILKEEIREYKETLTCPSCKVKRKDAVLTKCFHCFCYDCLRTRYETRQRKCPKCNAAFGASDYHRLYLS